MQSDNIYNLPESDANQIVGTGSTNGKRINRLNYISWVISIWFILPVMVAVIIIKLFGTNIADIRYIVKILEGSVRATGYKVTFDLFAFWYIQIPIFIYFTLKRIRDIELNQWLVIPFSLPLVNFIVWFWPGSNETNQWGPPTSKPKLITKLYVFTSLITTFVVILVGRMIVLN